MVGMPKLGPYSKSATLAKLDRRTKEARLLQSLRRELVAYVGGFPSTTQMLLIDQACALQLRLALMDKETYKVGAMTERNPGAIPRLVRFAATGPETDRPNRSAGTKGLASVLGANEPGLGSDH
jgi:hypothetical protein